MQVLFWTWAAYTFLRSLELSPGGSKGDIMGTCLSFVAFSLYLPLKTPYSKCGGVEATLHSQMGLRKMSLKVQASF